MAVGGQVCVIGHGVGLAAIVEVVPASSVELRSDGRHEGGRRLLGPIVAEYPRRFAALLNAALAESPNAPMVDRSPAVAQTLISTSIGIKHEVTTREAFLDRLATAIDVIVC
jgi:hypothetical protein